MKKKVLIGIHFLLLSICSVKAVNIGSDSVVNRFNTQQVLQNNDVVAGFASLAAGFRLFDMNATATFNSFFQVSGVVDLNGGTILLARDLILHNDATLRRLGGVDGDFHVFRLAPSTSLVPTITSTSCFTFSDLTLELSCDVTLQDCCITFTGNSTLDGRGYALTLSPTSTLQLGANSSLFVKDIVIKGVQNSLIKGLSNTSTFSFKNAELVLSGDYTFGAGFFDVLGDLRISGPNNAFIYQTDLVSTVSTNGTMILDYGVTFSYAPSASSRTLLRLLDTTSTLELYGSTLQASAVGLQLNTGNLFVSRRSFLVSNGISLATAITFDPTLNVVILPSATLELVGGFHEI